ncbi:G-protein coupled receptor moody isoform X1 [Nasonia vitripennis]|uniref:G-protein coupled receptors family 1 profile domain-containing protein n=2 Tax=Nasonia vitripennis TaxID=7425 RepID=A0A7M7H9T6_NASVI|nr:G-protein coupled receptor moody isoform X1 [Nasonia vitripennis]XP_008215385.1 G-protein coupled receptor moody isoform X1 [Nasonia vitripennis]
MLEYWMGSNESAPNASEFEIQEVIEDPGSASLFAGYPAWLLYFAAGCCALFMLIGIPGNLITVAALFRTKKLRNATAVFIMNLSMSDLMFCCFNLPLATSTFWHGSWLHGPLLCRLFPLLRYGLVAVSLFTVLAITINRYVMIGHPRLYPKLYKPKYLVLMVLATWIGGFGALIPTWFEQWGRFGLDPVIGSCSILPDVYGRSPKEFLFILAFLAPCIAIVVCYARIFYIVRKTAMKSRRRDEATRQLVHSNFELMGFEAKCSKNMEDSAIGSMSCQVTHTTISENGGSPLKCDHQGLMVAMARARSPSLRKISLPRFVERSDDVTASSVSHQNEQSDPDFRGVVIPELRVQDNNRSDLDVCCGQTEFAKSLETLPYIDVSSSTQTGNGNAGGEQILDSHSLQKASNTSRFLSPPATCRYDEVSDDCVSSRSDSPSERRRASNGSRRGDVTPTGSRVLRRESRFRSVRGRSFETGKMTAKDKKLLKMILVIFSSFLICYLPITITKTFKNVIDWRGLNIAGYILIYLTTCINPVIYVVMSSEYRSAYKNVLLCRSESSNAGNTGANAVCNEKRRARQKLEDGPRNSSRKTQRNG